MKTVAMVLLVASVSFGAAVVARAEGARHQLPTEIVGRMAGVQVNINELASPRSSLALMEFFAKPELDAAVRQAAGFAMCEREQLLGRVYAAQRGIFGLSAIDFEGRFRAVELLHTAVQELGDGLASMETMSPEFHAFYRETLPGADDTFQRLKTCTEALMEYATGCRHNIVKDPEADDGAGWKLFRRR